MIMTIKHYKERKRANSENNIKTYGKWKNLKNVARVVEFKIHFGQFSRFCFDLSFSLNSHAYSCTPTTPTDRCEE